MLRRAVINLCISAMSMLEENYNAYDMDMEAASAVLNRILFGKMYYLPNIYEFRMNAM